MFGGSHHLESKRHHFTLHWETRVFMLSYHSDFVSLRENIVSVFSQIFYASCLKHLKVFGSIWCQHFLLPTFFLAWNMDVRLEVELPPYEHEERMKTTCKGMQSRKRERLGPRLHECVLGSKLHVMGNKQTPMCLSHLYSGFLLLAVNFISNWPSYQL